MSFKSNLIPIISIQIFELVSASIDYIIRYRFVDIRSTACRSEFIIVCLHTVDERRRYSKNSPFIVSRHEVKREVHVERGMIR